MTWLKWFYALVATLTYLSPAIDALMNVALLKGSTLEFEFVTTIPFLVVWNEYSASPAGQSVFLNGTNIYQGGAAKKARFSTVIAGNGTHAFNDLYLSNVELADATKYEARQVLSSDFPTAQAIVLDRDIQCTVLVNSDPSLPTTPLVAGDDVNVQCTIPYNGEWGPVFSCTGIRLNNWAMTDTSAVMLASYNFTADVLSGATQGSISCDAFFMNPTPSEYAPPQAENIPDYTSSWSSGVLQIYYPATAATASPIQTTYSVNDIITCSASGGNPIPTYKWMECSNQLSSTAFLTITSDMAGQGFNVTCVATTVIRGVNNDLTVDLEFDVNSLPTTPSPPTTVPTTAPTTTTTTESSGGDKGKKTIDDNLLIIIIVSTLSGVLALVLIITLVVCCVKKAKKRKVSSFPDLMRETTSRLGNGLPPKAIAYR